MLHPYSECTLENVPVIDETYKQSNFSLLLNSDNFACFVFLKHPFWDSPFCLISDDLMSGNDDGDHIDFEDQAFAGG